MENAEGVQMSRLFSTLYAKCSFGTKWRFPIAQGQLMPQRTQFSVFYFVTLKCPRILLYVLCMQSQDVHESCPAFGLQALGEQSHGYAGARELLAPRSSEPSSHRGQNENHSLNPRDDSAREKEVCRPLTLRLSARSTLSATFEYI